MRYRLAERLAAWIHPQAVLSGRDRIWMRDSEVLAIYDQFKPAHARREWDRMYLLDQLATLIEGVDGDTVECGSYQGMSSYVICHRTQPGRRHHVFDSFEGLSAPGVADGPHWAPGDLSAQEQVVIDNLSGFDVVTYKGWIPSRFAEVSERKFALAHIDVDLYEPTRDALEFLYPRVSPGGVIVCDDYGFGTCPGAKRAFDEYMSDKPERVLSIPTGQGLILRGFTQLAHGDTQA